MILTNEDLEEEFDRICEADNLTTHTDKKNLKKRLKRKMKKHKKKFNKKVGKEV